MTCFDSRKFKSGHVPGQAMKIHRVVEEISHCIPAKWLIIYIYILCVYIYCIYIYCIYILCIYIYILYIYISAYSSKWLKYTSKVYHGSPIYPIGCCLYPMSVYFFVNICFVFLILFVNHFSQLITRLLYNLQMFVG